MTLIAKDEDPMEVEREADAHSDPDAPKLSKPLAEMVKGVQRGDRRLIFESAHLQSLLQESESNRQVFYQVIHGNDRIANISITPIAVTTTEGATNTTNNEANYQHDIYTDLGEAFATISSLKRISFVLDSSISALAAVCQLARPIRQNKRMNLVMDHKLLLPASASRTSLPPPSRPNVYDTLIECLADHVQLRTVRIVAHPLQSILVGWFCQVLESLPALMELQMARADRVDDEGPQGVILQDSDANYMASLIRHHQRTLRKLRVEHFFMSSAVGARAVATAISESSLTSLFMVGCEFHQLSNGHLNNALQLATLEEVHMEAMPFCSVNLSSAIYASRFTKLTLSEIIWMGLQSPRRLANAIARSNVVDFAMIGGQRCRPFNDEFLEAFGNTMHSNFRSLKLPLAMAEQAPQEQIMARERDLVNLLFAVRRCTNLEYFRLPYAWAWNDRLDAAAAACLQACTSLIQMHVEIPFHGIGRGCPAAGVFYESSALLAAAQTHMNIDRLSLLPLQYWNTELLKQCKTGKLGKRNHIRVFQPRFEAIPGTEPGLFGKSLVTAQRVGPHVVFLALTTNHSWLLPP
jgi:hypothetical protein